MLVLDVMKADQMLKDYRYVIIIFVRPNRIMKIWKKKQKKIKNSISFFELSNRIEPNRIEHGFAEFELFHYFHIFMSSVWSNRVLMHLNDKIWRTVCLRTNLDSTKMEHRLKNAQKLKVLKKISFRNVTLCNLIK